MLREFIAWLDDYLQSEGSPAIAKAVLGILSVAALPGAVFGSLLIKAAALVVAVLAVTSLGLILLADRTSLRRELEEHKQLVTRYCGHIRRQDVPYYQVTSWEQVSVITDDKGGADDVVTVRIRILRPDALFFRLAFGCGWEQPARYRRKVKTHVRSLLVDGMPGTSLQKTISWVWDGKFHMIVHFDSPPKENSEISVVVALKWPLKCAPLMTGRQKPDSFTFRFAEPVLRASYRLVLPVGCDAYCEPVGFGEEDEGFSIKRIDDADRRTQFMFSAVNMDAHHRVGMKLEIKRRGDISVPPPSGLTTCERN